MTLIGRLKHGACYLIVAILAVCGASECEAHNSSAVTFFSPRDLRTYGLASTFLDGSVPLKNKCYYLGDENGAISISESFLAPYARKGFSLQSLCLSIASGVRFDPESGRPLRYARLFNRSKLEFGIKEGLIHGCDASSKNGSCVPHEEGVVGQEITIDVPNCFKGAAPLSDCRFLFNPFSGKRLQTHEMQKVKDVAAKIESGMRKRLRPLLDCQIEASLGCGQTKRNGDGYFTAKGYDLFSFLRIPDPRDGHSESPFDVGGGFPRGYGYAINNFGTSFGFSGSVAGWSWQRDTRMFAEWSVQDYWREFEASKYRNQESATRALVIAQGLEIDRASTALKAIGKSLVGSNDLMRIKKEIERLEGGNSQMRQSQQEGDGTEWLIDRNDRVLTRLDDQLEAFVRPRPILPDEISGNDGLLADDEVVLQYSVVGESAFAWVLSKGKPITWRKLPISTRHLLGMIKALRCGLDSDEWESEVSAASCRQLLSLPSEQVDRDSPAPPFSLQHAYELYRALIEPLEKELDRSKVIAILSGPLNRLPLHVLVTQRGLYKIAESVYDRDYRNVPWLGRKLAISYVPSLSSLKTLRNSPKRSARGFLGLGNPILAAGSHEDLERMREFSSCVKTAASGLAGAPLSSKFASITRSGAHRQAADPRESWAELQALPDTAVEICHVASNFSEEEATVLLGVDASEVNFNSIAQRGELAKYNYLMFASHALLADEATNLGGDKEQAIVLTPGNRENRGDNGLLQTSEVASLKLGAHWVVLSGCSTAGLGDFVSSYGGLPAAFFAAGARGLIVSHWPVVSAAAAKLMGRALGGHGNAFRDAASSSPGWVLSQLNWAMMSMADEDSTWKGHPKYWAPFIVLGDGGR